MSLHSGPDLMLCVMSHSESENVLAEIQAVSSQYRPFAVACSSIYFTAESLSDVHFLYHFSLPFFLVVVDSLLQKPSQEVKVRPARPTVACSLLRISLPLTLAL